MNGWGMKLRTQRSNLERQTQTIIKFYNTILFCVTDNIKLINNTEWRRQRSKKY